MIKTTEYNAWVGIVYLKTQALRTACPKIVLAGPRSMPKRCTWMSLKVNFYNHAIHGHIQYDYYSMRVEFLEPVLVAEPKLVQPLGKMR